MTARPTTETPRTQYVSIGGAAARYNVSCAYIRRRIIDGSLPAVRSGRRIIRIRTTDLEHLFRRVQSMRPSDARREPLRPD